MSSRYGPAYCTRCRVRAWCWTIAHSRSRGFAISSWRASPATLDLVYSTPQSRAWAAYGGIDIALDPFPHNAGTTTIEALWQGVPVVTLAGRPTVGRFGAAILRTIGLDEWVTTDIDEYVSRAAVAAQDIDALSRLRAQIRPRF